MKTKKQTLRESVLPQLNKPFTQIVNGLEQENIGFRPVIVRVGQLKPIQNNIEVSKMDGMLDSLKNNKEFAPIYVSNDDYILDGHHRAAAIIKNSGRDEKIKCIRIDLDKDNGVRMMNKINDRMDFEQEHQQTNNELEENKKPKENVLRFNKKQLEEYAKNVIQDNLEEYDLNESNINKSYFIDPNPDIIKKAETYGLMDIENEDLTPEGLIQKMIIWDEGEHGVEAYVYDITKRQLEDQGYKMPDDIRRISDDDQVKKNPIEKSFHGGYHTDFPGYSLNEKDISEDKINEYLKLKEKFNVKDLPSEELSLENQDKFMEEFNKPLKSKKRTVRLNEKQFKEMIESLKNEYATPGLPIAGELPSQ